MQLIKLILKSTIIYCLFSSTAYSADAVTSKVVLVGITTNNDVFIELESPVTFGGCTNLQVLVPSGSDFKEEALSLALTAHASGKSLTIAPSGCINGNPSVDKGGAYGYIFIR
jgi:hypothetical protein